MADNIVDQNRKLASAGSKPKDTSHRIKNSDDQAAKVATSKKVSKQVSAESSDTVRNLSSSKLRGSFEGLDVSSNAVVNLADSGYDNKAIQSARYSSPQDLKPLEGLADNNFNLSSNYSIMDNYSSYGIKDTSMDRLGKIVKGNMMFG